MNSGRRIYYEKATGNVIQATGERSGEFVETTIEQDFVGYKALAERMPETVGVIQLKYGDYYENFLSGWVTRVDLETEGLLFSYPPALGEEPSPPQMPVEAKLIQLRNDLVPRVEATEGQAATLQTDTDDVKLRLGDVELALADVFTGGGE